MTFDPTLSPGPSNPYPVMAGAAAFDPTQEVSAGNPLPVELIGGIAAHSLATKAPSFTVNNPGVMLVHSGTFTPDADKVLVDVAPNFRVNEPGGCHVGVYLFYGANALPQFTPRTLPALTGAQPAGVTKIRLGAHGAYDQGAAGPLLLTGLTPGATYRYEVAVVVIGYAATLALPGQPISVDLAPTATPYPESANYVAVMNGHFMTLIKANHASTISDTIKASVDLVDSPIGRCRLTKDGARVIGTSQFGAKVYVVTTGALTGAAAALQGSPALPAGDTASYGVAVTPDGATAYVGIVGGTDVGKVVPITLATLAWGSAKALTGTAGDLPWDCVVDAAGTYLYTVHAGTNRCVVSRLKLSDNTVSTLVLSTSAGAVGQSIALSPDGANLYAAGMSATNVPKVWRIRTSDFTNQANWSPSGANIPRGIKVFGDNAGLLLVTDSSAGSAAQGAAGNQLHQHWTSDGQEYTTWINSFAAVANSPGYDLAISPNGSIYVGDYSHNTLNIWFGGVAWNPADDDFWMAETRVRVTGAR